MSCCGATAGTAMRSVAADPSKHVNYVTGMVLGVDEVTQEFAYLSARDRWLARDALGYGTLRGLAVHWREKTPGTIEPVVVVSAGVALSPCGQLICVPRDQCADVNLWLASHAQEVAVRFDANALSADLELHVKLAYRDCTTDPAPVPGEPCRSADELMQDSRVQDSFCLSLSLDPPPVQDEEDAVRAFVTWLNAIPVEANPATPASEKDFRDAVVAWKQAQAPAPLVLKAQDVPKLRQVALRLWVTELRPHLEEVAAHLRFDAWVDSAPAAAVGAVPATHDQFIAQARLWTPLTLGWPAGMAFDATKLQAYRDEAKLLWKDLSPKWYSSPCNCTACASTPALPDELLLGSLSLHIERTAGNPWQMVIPASGSPAPSVDDSKRPFIVHLRMAQQWLAQLPGAAAAAGPVVAPLARPRRMTPAPTPPPAPTGMSVVAAGLVPVSGLAAAAPVLGELRTVPDALAKGLVTFTFAGYAEPNAEVGLVVKVQGGVMEPGAGAQPDIRFDGFTPKGFVLNVSRANEPLEVDELKRLHVMLEVTRIAAAP